MRLTPSRGQVSTLLARVAGGNDGSVATGNRTPSPENGWPQRQTSGACGRYWYEYTAREATTGQEAIKGRQNVARKQGGQIRGYLSKSDK